MGGWAPWCWGAFKGLWTVQCIFVSTMQCVCVGGGVESEADIVKYGRINRIAYCMSSTGVLCWPKCMEEHSVPH